MNSSSKISLADINRLFSITMSLDEDLTIVHACSTLKKYVPGLEKHPTLTDVFELMRPKAIENYAGVLDHLNSLYLMIAKDQKFAIRGQMVLLQSDGIEHLCFLGSPWLFWIQENCAEIRLNMGDFAKQDVQLHQVFYMTTERRMVQDLEQLNDQLKLAQQEAEKVHQAKIIFFTQLSHEMRTPLNGVVSALALLDLQPLNSQAFKLVTLAQSASENLLHVINYVLDVSKIESSNIEGNISDFNCQSLVNDVKDVLSAKALEKGLALEVEYDKKLPTQFSADSGLISQTLLNLLSNAIKYTEVGRVTLKVRNVLPPLTVRFEVDDTGIGISSEDQQCVFDPFWTSVTGTEKGQPGTGLGLDIVRRNVKALNGRYGLISTPGVGSTFWFEVKLTVSALKKNIANPNSPKSAPGCDRRLHGHVLLVDDNQINLELVRMLLETFGVKVTTATDGSLAVSKAGEQNFDLVLMDLSMPVMGGMQATKLIHELSGQENLPIIAFTAHADKNEEISCLESGMRGYLTKPVRPDLLFSELDSWLNNSSEQIGSTKLEVLKQIDTSELGWSRKIDQLRLQELAINLGKNNFAIVVKKFPSEVAVRRQEMIEAAKSGDYVNLARQAHALSSTFRSFGLMSAGVVLSNLENDIKTGDISDVPSAANDIQKLLDASLAELNDAVETIAW